MAAILCRYLYGLRMLEENGAEIPDRDGFLCGLQGPDVFAYGLLFSKEQDAQKSRFAEELCKAEPQRLLAFCRENRPGETALDRSFRLGVLCCCLLEENLSPFISYGGEMISRLEPERTVEDCKHQVESSLDIILLRYETGKLPTEVRLKTAVPARAEICEAAGQFYRAFAAAEGAAAVSPAEASSLFAEGVKGIGKLDDRTLLKRQFLKRREKSRKKTGGLSSLFRDISEEGGYDYANVCENEWQWPVDTGAVRTETFFDLFEAAAAEGLRALAEAK